MTLIATLEQTAHLSSDDMIVANVARNFAMHECKSLDEAEKLMKFYFRGWFIYRGGNHIAVHLKSGDQRRILLVTEG